MIKTILLSVCALRRRFYRDADPGLPAAIIVTTAVMSVMVSTIGLTMKLVGLGAIPTGLGTFLVLGAVFVVASYSLGPVVKRWDRDYRLANTGGSVSIKPAIWMFAISTALFFGNALATWLL